MPIDRRAFLAGAGAAMAQTFASAQRPQPQPQAAEIEPPPPRLLEAEDSSSHWHNVTATFSTQHERTWSRSLGHSPLLIEKTIVLESR